MKGIKDLRVDERPRERLEAVGASVLSDQELLAVLFGSGTKGVGVHRLAKGVLDLLDLKGDLLSLEDLRGVPGMGQAKSTQILAALEFARRRIRPRGIKIRVASDVIPLLSHWATRDKEHFISITLNGAHEVIETRVVTIGLINSTQVHAREVFSDAITDRACAIIVAHNHPSGDLTPSEADRKVTRSLKEAGEILGIRLLDHIVFGRDGYYSFVESQSLA